MSTWILEMHWSSISTSMNELRGTRICSASSRNSGFRHCDKQSGVVGASNKKDNETYRGRAVTKPPTTTEKQPN
jgi:hypothetical protein